MKGSVILVPFPFTDFTATKLRPAVVLYENEDDVVVAFISSKMPALPAPADIPVIHSQPGFAATGLKTDSVIKLDKIATIIRTRIVGTIGDLPPGGNHKIPDNQTPDSDWPGAGTMKSTGRQTRKTPLEKIIDVITRSADPDRIILFGSRAWRDNRKTSDYDMCVLKHGVSRRRQLAMKLYRDLYGIGVPVELIVETPETFEKLKDNPFLIYHAIANRGKVVYEKPASR